MAKKTVGRKSAFAGKAARPALQKMPRNRREAYLEINSALEEAKMSVWGKNPGKETEKIKRAVDRNFRKFFVNGKTGFKKTLEEAIALRKMPPGDYPYSGAEIISHIKQTIVEEYKRFAYLEIGRLAGKKSKK